MRLYNDLSPVTLHPHIRFSAATNVNTSSVNVRANIKQYHGHSQNNLVFPIQAKPNQNSLPSLTFGSKDTAIKLCMMITMIDVVMAFFLFSSFL